MNTRALALAAVLSGLPLGACTSTNESVSVVISAVCLPTDDCSFTAECAAQYIGDYIVDGTADQFWLPVQVNNRLIDNAEEPLRVNTNDAHITSFEITYQGFVLASAVVPVNFRVPAAGFATVGLFLVPPQPGALGAPAATVQVLARVVAKGYFENGSSFETGEFPISFTFTDGSAPVPKLCAATETLNYTCGYPGTWPAAAECVAP